MSGGGGITPCRALETNKQVYKLPPTQYCGTSELENSLTVGQSFSESLGHDVLLVY